MWNPFKTHKSIWIHSKIYIYTLGGIHTNSYQSMCKTKKSIYCINPFDIFETSIRDLRWFRTIYIRIHIPLLTQQKTGWCPLGLVRLNIKEWSSHHRVSCLQQQAWLFFMSLTYIFAISLFCIGLYISSIPFGISITPNSITTWQVRPPWSRKHTYHLP